MSITLRPMRLPDLLEVEKLEQVIFSDAWPKDAFEEYLDNLNAGGWVAVVPSRIIGYACCWFDSGQAHLTNMAVDSAYQRKSVAKRLMALILGLARERECELIYLEARISNEAARRFYETLGFETVNRRIRYYQHPVEDALVMVQRLDSVRGDR
jgi:ribosomal-protein-alanine N-acetyltransferase